MMGVPAEKAVVELERVIGTMRVTHAWVVKLQAVEVAYTVGLAGVLVFLTTKLIA